MPVDLELSYIGGDTTFSVWVEADSFQEIEIPLTLPMGSSDFDLAFDPDNWLLDEHEEVVGLAERTQQVPKPETYSLGQNHPNPFNPVTQIKYTLPNDGHVRLDVHNILGQKVASLVDEKQKAGYKSARWGASSFSSGIYFYRLQAGDFVQTKKMVLLK